MSRKKRNERQRRSVGNDPELFFETIDSGSGTRLGFVWFHLTFGWMETRKITRKHIVAVLFLFSVTSGMFAAPILENGSFLLLPVTCRNLLVDLN